MRVGSCSYLGQFLRMSYERSIHMFTWFFFATLPTLPISTSCYAKLDALMLKTIYRYTLCISVPTGFLSEALQCCQTSRSDPDTPCVQKKNSDEDDKL